MANVIEGEPRGSQEWHGSYLDEDGIVADLLKRVQADAVAVKNWLDPVSWRMPVIRQYHMGKSDIPEHAGCLMFAGMSIRNFYGLWHADHPHTAFGLDDDVEITDGIITDARHPENMSGRIIQRVKAELAKLVPGGGVMQEAVLLLILIAVAWLFFRRQRPSGPPLCPKCGGETKIYTGLGGDLDMCLQCDRL